MARGGFYSVNSPRGVYVLVVDEDDETRAILRFFDHVVPDVLISDISMPEPVGIL